MSQSGFWIIHLKRSVSFTKMYQLDSMLSCDLNFSGTLQEHKNSVVAKMD